MFNTLLNTLWPVKELVDFIFTSIFADVVKCKVSKEDVEREIKSKTFYEIFDLEISAKTFNKKFRALSHLQLISGSIEKFYIKFPRNYFKEKIEIRLENVKFVVEGKNFNADRLNENMKCVVEEISTIKKELPGPIQKIINNILNNLEIQIKNILLEYRQEEDVSLSFMNKKTITESKKYSDNKINIYIGSILYTKLKDNTKDGFFLFNKQILFYNLYIKIIKNDGEDDFSLKDKKLIEKITDKSCNLVSDANDVEMLNNSNLINHRDLSCSIWIKFVKDEGEKDSLQIDTNLNKIEIILTKNHSEYLEREIRRLIIIKKKNYNLMQNFKHENEKNSIHNSKKDNVILTHKITKIKYNLSVTNLNCVLLENITTEDLTKPKIWLLYEEYFKKYYISFDDRIKDNFNTNSIENIQKHFSYLEDNFFLINISNFNIKSTFNLSSSSQLNTKIESITCINEMQVRYIEPNNKAIKKDFMLVKNPCTMTNETEKFFDEKYSKIFINSMKYGYSFFIITSIEKIDVKIRIRDLEDKTLNNSYQSSEFVISMNEIKTEFNEFVFLKIYYYLITNLASEETKKQAIQCLSEEIDSVNPDILDGYDIECRNSQIKDDKIFKQDHNTEDKTLINYENTLCKMDKQSNAVESVRNSEHSDEVKVIFTFKLDVTFSHFSQGNLLFKEFYNTYIHLPNDVTFSYNPRRIFKIGENLKNKESITIRVSPGELVFHKNYREHDLNVYFDVRKIFFFYVRKNICFPVVTYKNSLFLPIGQGDLDFMKIEKLKKWTLKLTNISNFNNNSYEDFYMKHAMNFHNITSQDSLMFDQLNFFNTLTFLKSSKDNKHIKSNKKFLIQFNLKKFEILLNFSNFNNLVDHLKISCFYFQYFLIFKQAIENKIEAHSYKHNLTDVKKYFDNFSIFIELNEISVVAFSNLNAYYDGFNNGKGNYFKEDFLSSIYEAEKYLINEENIFNIIENPFLKLQLSNFHFTQFKISSLESLFIISLENFKILVRKNENIYHDIKIKHQIYYQNIYEEENFDNILHKGMNNDKSRRNLISLLINLKKIPDLKNEEKKFLMVGEEYYNFEDFIRKFLNKANKKNQFKITSAASIDDLVLCPLFMNFEESIKLIQYLKKENSKQTKITAHPSSKKENSYLDRSIHSLKEEIKTSRQEIIFNEKLFNIYQNLNENESENRKDSKDQRSSDYYSKSSNVEANSFNSNEMIKTKYDTNVTLHIGRIIFDLYSHVDDKNKISTKIEHKDKMRLIIEIESVKYEDIITDSLLDLNILNSNGLKTVLDCDSNFCPRSVSLKISKINSIFLKNLDYSSYAIASLTNRCQNIYKENSYWRKVGFSEIINIDGVIINLKKVLTNFKSEIIFNIIEFNFCKDSFKYFKKFLERSKIDLELLKASLTEMPESIFNEMELSHEKNISTGSRLKKLNINDNISMFNCKESNFNQNINTNLDSRKCAEIKRNGINLKDFNLNSRNKDICNQPQSYSLNQGDNVLILDKNSQHYSITDSFDKDRKINFNSTSFYQTDLKDGESFIRDQSINDKDINEVIANRQDNNPFPNSDRNKTNKEISERLSLLFVVHNFNFYLLEGKDFLFEDKYSEITMINTDHSFDGNKYEHDTDNKMRTYSETLKTQGDCNITISINPKTIKIIDDYLMTGGMPRKSNKKQQQINQQMSNCRLKKNKRNYSSYLCFNAENVEIRLSYYRYDSLFFYSYKGIRLLFLLILLI